MIGLLVAVSLVAGCARALPPVTVDPPSDPDAAAIAAVVDAWNDREDLVDVDEDLVLARIRVTDPPDVDAFRSLCGGACAPSDVAPNCSSRWGRAGACAPIYNRCTGPFCGLVVPSSRLVVIAPGRAPAARLSLLVHEVVHHVSELTAMDSDRSHLDGRRWCDYSAGGCSGDNVEHVAREALR